MTDQTLAGGIDANAHTSTWGVILRQGLTILGSLLVAKGLVTADQSGAIITGLAGVLPIIASVAWSLWQKVQQKKVVAAALATPIPK